MTSSIPNMNNINYSFVRTKMVSSIAKTNNSV